MKRILLASAALLVFSPLASAQLPVQAPATPPIVAPAPAAPEIPAANAQTEVEAAGAVQAEVPTVSAQTQGSANVQAEAPAVAADAQGSVSVQAAAPAVTPHAAAQTAGAVCQTRTTSVNFGARATALNRENANALEYAVDDASVCSLEGVVIATGGSLGERRAAWVRQILIARGVPEDKITVAAASEAYVASHPNQLDVRMNFAGAAGAAPQTQGAVETSQSPS